MHYVVPEKRRVQLLRLTALLCMLSLTVSLGSTFVSGKKAHAATAATLAVNGTPMGISSQYIGAGYGYNQAQYRDLGFNTTFVGGSLENFEPQDDDGTYGSPSIDQIKTAGTAISTNGLIPWSYWDGTAGSTTWRPFWDQTKQDGVRVVMGLRIRYQSDVWMSAIPKTQADWNEWWEHVFALGYWLNVRNNYGIDDWQVLNEPNNTGEGWNNNAADYEVLVQYTTDALEYLYKTFLPDRHPNILVSALSYPQAWGNGVPNGWQDDVLHWTGNGNMTASYHYYHTGNEWINGIANISHPQLNNATLANNQVWVTEWGGGADDQGTTSFTPLNSVHEINDLIAGSQPGNGYLYGTDYFDWSSPSANQQYWGIVDENGNPRSIYYALRLASRALNNGKATYATTVSNTTDLTAITTRDDNGNVYVLITNQSSTTDYTIDSDLSALYSGSTSSTTLYRYDSSNADAGTAGPAISNGHASITVPASGAVVFTFNSGSSGKDTQAPAAPTNLSVTAHSDSSLDIAWAKATDNVGIDHYDIYLNGERFGGASGDATSAHLRNLSQGTAYSIVVKAIDARGNSTASAALSVTTDAASGGKYEAENGTFDSNSIAHRNYSGHAGYSGNGYVEGYWTTGASDTITVSVAQAGTYTMTIRYINGQPWDQTIGLYVNGTRVGTPNLAHGPDWNTWMTQTVSVDLLAGTNTIGLAHDADVNGNQIFDSIELSGAGVIAPPVLTNAIAGAGNVSLSWNAVSGASSYDVYRSTLPGLEDTTSNTTPLATGITTTSYTDNTATAGSQYYYKVAAHVGQGVSQLSNELTTTTSIPAPTAQLHPRVQCILQLKDGSYVARFSYKSDNTTAVAVPVGDSNKFYPDPQDRGQPIIFQPGDHKYAFNVPFDGSKLVWTLWGHTAMASASDSSIDVCAPDTQAPTAPTNLVSTHLTATTVDLNWQASTDNIGVTGYDVYVNGVKTMSTSGANATQVTVSGLTPAVTYTFAVKAFDGSGNVSDFSNSITVTTNPDWTATASNSFSSDVPANAVDRNLTTRWSSGTPQQSGQWFQVDLKRQMTFSSIVLDEGSSIYDYPRGYDVYVSNDGTNWGSAIATGAGSQGKTTINFSSVTTQYVKIVLNTTPTDIWWWSIHEFYVYP